MRSPMAAAARSIFISVVTSGTQFTERQLNAASKPTIRGALFGTACRDAADDQGFQHAGGFRRSDRPAGPGRLLRDGPRGWGRDDPPVHGRLRARLGGATDRDASISVSLRRKWLQAARLPVIGACHGARGGRRGRTATSIGTAHRRRQVVRRPDDFAGPSQFRIAKRGFRCIPRESHPSSGPRTSPTSRSPCCSSREHAIRWPT
jgi:hypothetical protein